MLPTPSSDYTPCRQDSEHVSTQLLLWEDPSCPMLGHKRLWMETPLLSGVGAVGCLSWAVLSHSFFTRMYSLIAAWAS